MPRKSTSKQPNNRDFPGEARRLLFGGRSGALSTTFRGKGGGPYGSLVTYAPDQDGSPIFLFSTLSDHTQNLDRDDRASLLIDRAQNLKNPQRGPRVTLMGRVKRTKTAFCGAPSGCCHVRRFR